MSLVHDFTHSGLPCHVVKTNMGHYCGYVGVPADHPWHGKDYSDTVYVPDEIINREVSIDKVGAINMLCANSEGFEKGEIDLVLAVDVHGGLTYASKGPGGGHVDGFTWWLGFDCAHCDDDPSIQDADYTKRECRSLADQIRAAENFPRVSRKEQAQLDLRGKADALVDAAQATLAEYPDPRLSAALAAYREATS